jgi:hypothetical protein
MSVKILDDLSRQRGRLEKVNLTVVRRELLKRPQLHSPKWRKVRNFSTVHFAPCRGGRVTRLDGVAPIVRLFTLGDFLKITKVAQFLWLIFPWYKL